MRWKEACFVGVLCVAAFLAYAENVAVAHHFLLTINEPVQVVDFRDPKGNVYMWLYDKEGNLKGYWNPHNNLTNPGRDEFIREVMGNQSLTPAKWIAIGTGDDTDGDPHNNTALVAEVMRGQAEYWEFEGGYGLNYTFTFTQSYTIKEAGVLNAASGGILVFYVNDLLIGVNNGDSLKICWKAFISGN
ncbi:MAG: hypothetical protein DRN81_06920 [Thermoproteota archaeon]|nr:MAG: hypothetical protein DRN81_06920 [Candidatus Korarchaeota archaeon]